MEKRLWLAKFTILIVFSMTASGSFAQLINPNIKIDTISIVKPEAQEVILDASITKDLEAFKDKDDAIIYIYRLSSMVGAAAKWEIRVDEKILAKLGQKEYAVAHINTSEKNHWISYPDIMYNYVNFKPNMYYFSRHKGFDLQTGYLDNKEYDEIKSCKIFKSVMK